MSITRCICETPFLGVRLAWAGGGSAKVVLSIRRTSPTRAASASSASSSSCSSGSSVVGVHERQVLGLDGEAGHRGAGRREQRLGGALTARGELARGLQRARQRQRARALLGAQQRVAAGHRQPVGLAHRRQRLDPHGQVQVGHQAADHDELLGVLLAEEGDVGERHAEQLGDDGRDAAEVLAAARGALEALAHAEHLDGRGEAGGVDLLDGGREQHVGACGRGRARASRSSLRG